MAVRDPPETPLGAAGQERDALEVQGRGGRRGGQDGARWLPRPGLYRAPPAPRGCGGRGRRCGDTSCGESGRPRVGSAAARVRCRLSMLPRGSAGIYIRGPGCRRQRVCWGSIAEHRVPLLTVLRLSAPQRAARNRAQLRSAPRLSPDGSAPHCSARCRTAPRGRALPRRRCSPEPRRPARPRQRAPLRRPRPPRRSLPRAAGWPRSPPS